MDQDLFNKNLSQSNNLKSNDSTHLQLGGSLILGPKFDIKKYINEKYYEKSERKEKINLPRLFNNKQKPTKLVTNHELFTIANENLPSYKKNPIRIKKQSFDKSTTISNNNNSIIGKNSERSYTINNLSLSAAKDNNAKVFETINVSKNNNYKKIFYSESNSRFNDIPKNDNIYDLNNENINLLKTIKKIKKQVDSAHKDKSIKNIMRNRIAYSPNYSDLVFKPNRIINDYNNFRERDLNYNKDDISNFINDNKDISKRNLLIKLLQKQKKDYSKDLSHRQKTIDDTRRTIEIDENNYECFTTNQKQACRRIEKNLNILLAKNRRLKAEQQKFTAELRVKEDERQKLLEQIDEYRIIAKFVSRVLESHINLFKVKIMPDYSSDQLPDYGNVADEVCERYNFLLNDEKSCNNNMNQESIDIINEMNDLSESELYHQFHKMEDNIVHYLKIHDLVNKEIMVIKKERKKQSDDFEIRIKNLEEELEHYKSLYEIEQKEYEDICHRNKTGNFELDEIVIDLYHDVMDIFNVRKKDEETKKNHLISVNKALLETQNLIIDKEEALTELISIMESYEKSNRYLFYRIIHARKNENKEMKFNLMKQIIEAGEKEKMAHMKSPDNKIIFIKRKAEPPYQEPKKDKEVKIDPHLVKQLENEELMSYK